MTTRRNVWVKQPDGSEVFEVHHVESTAETIAAARVPRECTGGQSSRDLAQIRNMAGRWCLYGTFGQFSHEFDAGGPIDAPDMIPAGCMDSTYWRNGSGAAVGRTSYVRREGAAS